MAESSMSLKTSFEQLEWHVKGGGKMALLVSRDLIRVTGQCIRLSKNSGRTLYRWNGEGNPLEKHNHDEKAWEAITVLKTVKELMATWSPPLEIPGSGTPIGGGSDSNTPSVKIEPDSLLWLPFYQSTVVADGGASRDTMQLKFNLSMCSWALNKHSVDEESETREGSRVKWPGRTILLGGFNGNLPPELSAVTHVIRWDFPTRGEIRELICGEVADEVDGHWVTQRRRQPGSAGSIFDELDLQMDWNSQIDPDLNNEFLDKLIQAAQGLDIEDCRIAILGALRNGLEEGEVTAQSTIDHIRQRKVDLLSSDGLLTPTETEGIEELGGLENIIEEIQEMKPLFESPQASLSHNIKPPKGVLLTGVPGCGKSLSAKTIAKTLELPLLAFDLGNITTSLYGETEENMHRALKQAEGMAPCVLWIDEFEKMFSSAEEGSGSHEVTQRINAIFLKWMEERKNGVFVVATSNDLSKIKAEYQRTGRWDGTYFFDLPSRNERRKILELNLEKTPGGYDFTEENFNHLLENTRSWASSDVAALIKESEKVAFSRWRKANGEQWKEATGHPHLTFDDANEVLDKKKISPMCDKDSVRLDKIRIGGKDFTPASRYDDDDQRVEFPGEAKIDPADIEEIVNLLKGAN